MSGTGLLVLVPRDPVSITLSQRHDPDVYYRTRSGLYVGNECRRRIISKATPITAGTSFKVNVFELGHDAANKEIRRGLPKNYLFKENVLCAIVAEMISKQSEGEPGDLENTGNVHVLRTSSWEMLVYWHRVNPAWNVLAQRRFVPASRRRRDLMWVAGTRFLCPN